MNKENDMTQEFVTLRREVVEQTLEALDSAKVWKTLNLHKLKAPHVSDAAAALRTALEQPDVRIRTSVPADWKLVPVEPTKEMKSAGAFAAARANANSYSPVGTYIPVDAMALMSYRAMLAAAPQPPVAEQPQVEKTPEAYLVRSESRFEGMLFFDRNEAQTYCDEGEKPEPLYAK